MSFGKIKETSLDLAFSWYIRSRDNWTCVATDKNGKPCGKRYMPPTRALHASHFWGRSNWKVRFDPDNVHSHCYGHHQYFGSNPQEFREWMIKKLGKEKFEALSRRAHWRTRQRYDPKIIEVWLRNELPKYKLNLEDFMKKKEKQEMCIHHGQEYIRAHCVAHPRKRKVKMMRKENGIQV